MPRVRSVQQKSPSDFEIVFLNRVCQSRLPEIVAGVDVRRVFEQKFSHLVIVFLAGAVESCLSDLTNVRTKVKQTYRVDLEYHDPILLQDSLHRSVLSQVDCHEKMLGVGEQVGPGREHGELDELVKVDANFSQLLQELKNLPHYPRQRLLLAFVQLVSAKLFVCPFVENITFELGESIKKQQDLTFMSKESLALHTAMPRYIAFSLLSNCK